MISIPPFRYLLSNDLEQQFHDLRKKTKSLTPENIIAHVHGMGYGASIGMAKAHEAVEAYKKVLGKHMIAAFVFGAVGRGYPKEREPKDIDLVVITKNATRDHLRSLPKFEKVSSMVLPHTFMNADYVRSNAPDPQMWRSVLALDTIALHGTEHVRSLRAAALTKLHERDFDRYVRLQLKKRAQDVQQKGKEKPSRRALKSMIFREFGIQTALAKGYAYQKRYLRR